MTPDAAGIEAALADVLAAHRVVWENDGGDYGGRSWFECTCDADNVLDATEYATEAEHRAHQAAALLPVVTQAQAAERERVAQAIEAEASRMHAAFAAEEDDHLADMKNRLGVDLEPGHWNRHDDGCGMCGMSSAARIARADESGA